MEIIILCALCIPIIYLALRQKKWYLYLLVAFIGILPEQFSISLHDKLPLLTGSRVLILIAFGFWLWNRWKTKNFSVPLPLLIFFAIQMLVSVINLHWGVGEIKRIFLYLFERVLVILMVMDTVDTKEEFHRAIDFMILGGIAVSVIGIVQTVWGLNPAKPLHITETITSVVLASRMGLTRAYGTMNAISFGCYCAFLLPIIYYQLEKFRKLRYSFAFAVVFMALICTFTRSAWLCVAGIFALIVLLCKFKPVVRLMPSAGIAILLCVYLCIAQPKLFSALVETGKSSINTITAVLPIPSLTEKPSETLPPTEPDDTVEPSEETKPKPNPPTFELDENFGVNANDPTYSRVAQWTAVQYMTQEGHLLFGYGYNALLRGKIHFFFDRWAAKWQPTTFLDVGLVSLLTESGLIGFLATICLLAYITVIAWRRRKSEEGFNFFRLTLYVILMYLLLNFLASFLNAGVVWLYFGLFFTKRKLDDLPEKTAE